MTVVPQCPPVPAPGMAAGLLDSWLDAGVATLEGLGKCWATTLQRGPAALDLPRWLAVTTDRQAPSWTTPHEIVFESPLARLRDFSVSRRRVVPTLVLPPQAGHDSCIVDYSADQSQMRTILEAGLERALSLDWVGATGETANASIEDYMDVVDRAVEHCGGRVNLIGDCQGGWLATIYAALHPERVNTLTIAGAPIDFHAGEPVIHEVMRRVAPDGNLRFYETLVASGGGILRGQHMLAGFIMIQPGAEISRQIDLLLNLDDPSHVARYREFEDWFKHTQDCPGGVLPVDRPSPVPRQLADPRVARGPGPEGRPRPDRDAAEPARGRRRPHHAAGAGLCAGGLRVHGARARHAAHKQRRTPRPVHEPRSPAPALAAGAVRGRTSLPRVGIGESG